MNKPGGYFNKTFPCRVIVYATPTAFYQNAKQGQESGEVKPPGLLMFTILKPGTVALFGAFIIARTISAADFP